MRILGILFCCTIMFFTSVGQADVSTIVADTKSGLVFSSKNATEPQYPASLTKVMTLYLTFNALENGLLKMDDRLPVSYKAASQPRSKLYVKPGETIRVRDAVMALIIISANDVAVVLAEALAPSEEEFAKMMTNTARDLGLKKTTFKNASGLHNPEQVTTAQDMAVLAMAVISHFPKHYKLFASKTFNYRGRVYKTHNHVQKKYAGAEGLKTGFISAVGYNIISTAKRNNHRLVSVVIGQNTIALRDKQAMNLLDKGFTKIQKQTTVFNRLKKTPGQSALDKKAILSKPDMDSYLKVMAKRLDETVKTTSPRERSRLMALAPTKPSAIEEGDINAGDVAETQIKEESATEEKSAQVSIAETDAKESEKQYVFGVQTKEESIKEEKSVQVAIAETDAKETAKQGVSVDPREEGFRNYADVKKEQEALRTGNIKKKSPALKTDVKTVQVTPKEATGMRQGDTIYSWGVQVGAFSSEQVAHKEAKKAVAILKAGDKVIKTTQSDTIFRSRIFGFGSRREAKNACQKLKNRKMKCLPLSPVS